MTDSSSEIIPDWPVPESVHACITTRYGGCSQRPYQTNNLAMHVGDRPADVHINRQQLSLRQGMTDIQWLEQVHGVDIIEAEHGVSTPKADGVVTQKKGIACAVLTADCLPLLVCDRQGTQVAALHAGWRGLAAGILHNGVSRFVCPADQLLVYLGPAISQKHFEVGGEVLQIFMSTAQSESQRVQVSDAFLPNAGNPGHYFADLYALARLQLQWLGVKHIYGGSFCTFSQSEHFYSYRKNQTTGRMASLIWLT